MPIEKTLLFNNAHREMFVLLLLDKCLYCSCKCLSHCPFLYPENKDMTNKEISGHGSISTANNDIEMKMDSRRTCYNVIE